MSLDLKETFTKRMQVVATTHLALTVCSGLELPLGWFPSGNGETHLWAEAWQNLGQTVFAFLQPQFWLLSEIERFEPGRRVLFFVPHWIMNPVVLLSIPLWSLCFGWLYTKAIDWLNRYPILGNRVF